MAVVKEVPGHRLAYGFEFESAQAALGGVQLTTLDDTVVTPEPSDAAHTLAVRESSGFAAVPRRRDGSSLRVGVVLACVVLLSSIENTAAASITATAGTSTAELGAASDTETAAGLAQAGPVTQTDDAGSAAYGSATGNAVLGNASFTAHGCAAPNQTKSTGSANGLARVNELESFTIVSGSHPAGTFVDVSFQFSAIAQFNRTFQNGDSTGDAVGGTFQATVGAYDLGSFDGSVSHSGNAIDGVATIVMGAWDGERVTQSYTRNGDFRVGDPVTIFADGLAQAGASADWAPMMASVADADVEAIITWGMSVAISGGGGGGVELVSQSTGMPAPPYGHGGIDEAEQNLPPRPPTVPMNPPAVPAFLPIGHGILVACLLLAGHRRARVTRVHGSRGETATQR